MLSIRNLAGEEEGLVGIQNLSRNRKVNGEKVISLTVIPSKANAHSYKLIEEESIVYFEDEPYVIKKLNERSIGKTTIKRGDAIHKFYVDLINKQQPKIHNGSITFKRYMEEFVFEGTGIEVVIIDSFPARAFENLGNDNRLALLSKGIDRYQAEFELVGNQARFRHQIGNKSDFQFRYGHNIKAINVDVDTTNLATVIRGTGDPELGIEAYHRSDNADIFGELDAPPVDDERFKSKGALLEEMLARLQDVPMFSLQIDFADLRAAGYPYTIPNEGDSVFVIYEPMNDLEIETRILDIDEIFDKDLKVIKTVVTLANYKKTLAGAMFDRTQKQLREIVDDDGIVKYSVLDEAVRIATEALESAQTQLLFDNGIIARDKNDPNRLVLLNSEGIGISSDGGQTFREAITSDGFVLTAGAIGRLKANNIQIGPSSAFETNYDPSTKETPGGAQDKADEAEFWAKEHADEMDAALEVEITRQGTFIDHTGVYTGRVSANQVRTGQIISENDVTNFNLNNGRLQFNHSDGTFTRIGVDGIRRHTSLDARNYHYLFHVTSFVYGQSSSSARWITLPSDFRNKDFKIYFAIADSMGAPSYNYSIQRFVCTRHPDHSIDYARARVPVIAYKSNTLMNGNAPLIDSVQGLLFAIY